MLVSIPAFFSRAVIQWLIVCVLAGLCGFIVEINKLFALPLRCSVFLRNNNMTDATQIFLLSLQKGIIKTGWSLPRFDVLMVSDNFILKLDADFFMFFMLIRTIVCII